MRFPQPFLLTFGLLLLGGCASMSPFRPDTDAAGVMGDAAEAQVLPGDNVVLKIWNEPEMSDTFVVANDGTLSLPKLGGVSTENQTTAGLQETLRVAYMEFLRNPSIDIRVLRRVGVGGEVKTPGIYYVDLTMTLPDVIAEAGGLTEAANQNRIVIHRDDTQMRYARSDQMRYVSAELRSGDQVVVGTRSFISRNSWAVVTSGIPLLGFVLTTIIPAIRDL